jgi:hypothetical protein
MALAFLPLTFASATVAVAGTAVAPTAPVPDNCKTIILLNIGAGAALYGIAEPGVALIEGVTGTRIPANGTLTLDIGTTAQRGPMDDGQVVGSGLVFDGVGGTTPVVQITYINVFGQPE